MALELIGQPTRFLSTVQTGITFAAVVGSIYAGAPLAAKVRPSLETLPVEWIRSHAGVAAEALVSFLVGSATVLFGELIPKRLALIHPETLAINLAWVMHAAATAASPLIRAMSWVADLILRLCGQTRAAGDTVTEDEVRLLIDQGIASGVFHEGERRMVAGALALDTTTAEQLMTPSNRVVWLNLADSDEVNWRKVVASGHSWFPVFRGTPDKALGVVSVKRLWSNLSLTGTAVVRDLVTDAPSVTPGCSSVSARRRSISPWWSTSSAACAAWSRSTTCSSASSASCPASSPPSATSGCADATTAPGWSTRLSRSSSSGSPSAMPRPCPARAPGASPRSRASCSARWVACPRRVTASMSTACPSRWSTWTAIASTS